MWKLSRCFQDPGIPPCTHPNLDYWLTVTVTPACRKSPTLRRRMFSCFECWACQLVSWLRWAELEEKWWLADSVQLASQSDPDSWVGGRQHHLSPGPRISPTLHPPPAPPRPNHGKLVMKMLALSYNLLIAQCSTACSPDCTVAGAS